MILKALQKLGYLLLQHEINFLFFLSSSSLPKEDKILKLVILHQLRSQQISTSQISFIVIVLFW